jgi:outer membrane protein assembly factor BamD
MTGAFYHTKGSYPAAANRLSFVADQYPLFSGSDEALWESADSFMKMGDRFESQAAEDYTRIVRDYPLSKHAPAAKSRLEAMKRPVPAPDPKAVARMQYEAANRKKPSMLKQTLNLMSRSPETYMAAKQGDPAMASLRPPVPVSVPNLPGTTIGPGGVVTGGAGTGSDVTVGLAPDSKALDSAPDARQTLGAGGAPAAAVPGAVPGSVPGAATPGAVPGAEAPGVAPGAAAPTADVTGKAAPTADEKAAADKAAADKTAMQPLPTNHVAPKKTKKQLKQEEEFRKKQVAAMQKQAEAKKAEEDAAKKTQPDPTKQPPPDSKQQ